MTDKFDPSKDVTIGTEVVVVLPPEGSRPEKIRRAIVREVEVDPDLGVVLTVEVYSVKSPGATYWYPVLAEQIAAIYESDKTLHEVRLIRAKIEPFAGAQPTMGFTSYTGSKKTLLN